MRRPKSSDEPRHKYASRPRGFLAPFRSLNGLVILLLVMVASYYGLDFSPPKDSTSNSPQQKTDLVNSELAQFTSTTVLTTKNVWQDIFQQLAKTYHPPELVMFQGVLHTECGKGQPMVIMGSFYCPITGTVYIDLSFYQILKNKLGPMGDTAQRYVVVHEIAHHVQNLLGIENQVRQMRQRTKSPAEMSRLVMQTELQADCFAGVWEHVIKQNQALELNSLPSILNAIQALEKQENKGNAYDFTLSTPEQSIRWFKRGFDSGDILSCNTFDEQ